MKNLKLLQFIHIHLRAEGTREQHRVPVTRGHGVHVQGGGHVSEGVQPHHLVLGQGQLLDQAEEDQGGEHGDDGDESVVNNPPLVTNQANVHTCNVLRVTLSHPISLDTPQGSGKMRIFCDTSPREIKTASFVLILTVSLSCLSLQGLSISPLCQCLSPVFTKRNKQVNTNTSAQSCETNQRISKKSPRLLTCCCRRR